MAPQRTASLKSIGAKLEQCFASYGETSGSWGTYSLTVRKSTYERTHRNYRGSGSDLGGWDRSKRTKPGGWVYNNSLERRIRGARLYAGCRSGIGKTMPNLLATYLWLR